MWVGGNRNDDLLYDADTIVEETRQIGTRVVLLAAFRNDGSVLTKRWSMVVFGGRWWFLQP